MTGQSENPWDLEAEKFDEAPDHGLLDAQVRAGWAQLIAKHVPRTGHAIDIGCGTGSLCLLLAESGLAVTGIDSSTRMIERARRKALQADASIEFRVDDAASLRTVSGGFDIVLARHVLWALPDPRSALALWAGLLNPGGRLILIEGFWHTGAGLHRHQVQQALPNSVVEVLSQDIAGNPILWGGAVSDERFLVVADRC